jgi:hypothetical protein
LLNHVMIIRTIDDRTFLRSIFSSGILSPRIAEEVSFTALKRGFVFDHLVKELGRYIGRDFKIEHDTIREISGYTFSNHTISTRPILAYTSYRPQNFYCCRFLQ